MRLKKRERKDYEYQGELDGWSLAKFLNGQPSGLLSGFQKEIEAIVTEYNKHVEIGQQMRETTLGNLGVRVRNEQIKIQNRLFLSLRRRLNHYSGHLAPARSAEGDIALTWQLDPVRIEGTRIVVPPQLLEQIQDLSAQGLLPRLRRCQNEQCQRWFFARFPQQRSCERKCRVAKWNAKHKEKRKEYYETKDK